MLSKTITIIIAIIICTCPSFAQTPKQKTYVKFPEYNYSGCGVNIPNRIPLPSPIKQLDNTQNKDSWINLIFEAEVPDSIKSSINVAKSIWESKLSDAVPIYLYIEMASLNEDLATEIAVGYCGGEMDGYPGALASQVIGETMGTIEYPDAIISLNSNLEWDCESNSTQSSTFNATTIALRGFARCFGFGSTINKHILQPTAPYYYSENIISQFDKYIITARMPLLSYPINSLNAIRYIENGPLYIYGKNKDDLHPRYRIYTNRESFVAGINLSTIMDESSLMHHKIGRGDKFLYVDNITVSILNALGWNFDQEQIGCNIVFENGETADNKSIYPPQVLQLDNGTGSQVTSYAWTLYLPKSDGELAVVQTGEQSTFTIEPLTKPELYQINENKQIQAIIECKYYSNGEQYTSTLKSVSIDLKPIILSVDNVTKLPKPENNSFGVAFTIKYRGTSEVEVDMETQYNPAIYEFYFYGDCETAVTLPNYYSEFLYNWAHIYVNNSYGSDSRTLEFEPSLYMNGTASISEKRMDDSDLIFVYSIDGRCIFSGTNAAFESTQLAKGIYIKIKTISNGQNEQEKIIIQ